MSRGTQVYSVRININLYQLIQETITRRNAHSPLMPWTFSDFITIAAREKYYKMKRSRRSHRRRPAAPPLAKTGAFS